MPQPGANQRFYCYELVLAKVKAVRPEHSRKKGDKRMCCDLVTMDGIPLKNVKFAGATVDQKTGYPHGFLIPPRVDQMVGVFFVKGFYANPIIAFSVPSSFDPQYKDNFYDLLESENDSAFFHKSGSMIYFSDDGSIEIKNLKGNGDDNGTAKLDGSTGQWSFNGGNLTVDV
jgi:hypothetical protein